MQESSSSAFPRSQNVYASTLRRSCYACIKAKRKCSLKLPKCQRCIEKDLGCDYQNEPLAHSSFSRASQQELVRSVSIDPSLAEVTQNGAWEEFKATKTYRIEYTQSSDFPSTQEDASDLNCAMFSHDLHSLSSSVASRFGRTYTEAPTLTLYRLTAPIIIQVESGTITYMLRLCHRHIQSFALDGGNSFIHRDISTNNSQLIGNLRSICRQVVSTTTATNRRRGRRGAASRDNDICRIEQDLECVRGNLALKEGGGGSLVEQLLYTQCLILIQILTLYILPYLTTINTSTQNPSPSFITSAITRQHLLHRSTQQLWSLIPASLPHKLPPRVAFLLAESVRRTIIISGEVKSLWHAKQKGWIEHNGFLDTLPFDRRVRLWEPGRGEEDDAEEEIYGGKQELISWREFTDAFDEGRADVRRCNGWEIMLLVGAKGWGIVEARLKESRRGSSGDALRFAGVKARDNVVWP